MNKISLPNNGSSLHEIVREEISRRIAAGVYKPGDAITSTAQLVAEFGVSSTTVKRALRDLRCAGLLTSMPGKGTFVKHRCRFIQELDVCMSSSLDNARWLDFQTKIELVSISRERVSNSTLSIFDPQDKVLVCIRKVIYADEVPIMYDSSFLPVNISDEIIDEFSECFIIDALRRHNVDVKDISLIIDSAPASREAQQVFQAPNGYPTLRRLYKSNNSTLSVFGVVESPFDRLACRIGFVSSQFSKIDKKK
ncbi:GntR family transcriptional regulator [Paraburkholderia diazotrophica]|nr:GntR family transcriptional regulator [Paraburkholderia diazotrophica]